MTVKGRGIPSHVMVATAVEFAQQGKTARDLAEHFNVTNDAVHLALRRAGASDLSAALVIPPKLASHGTASCYEGGCRCDPCTEVHTQDAYRRRKNRAALPPSEIPHGRGGRSNYGCECAVCLEASRALIRERASFNRSGANEGKSWTADELSLIVQRQGTRRYLYSARECALRLGRSVSAIDQKRAQLRRATKSKVA